MSGPFENHTSRPSGDHASPSIPSCATEVDELLAREVDDHDPAAGVVGGRVIDEREPIACRCGAEHRELAGGPGHDRRPDRILDRSRIADDREAIPVGQPGRRGDLLGDRPRARALEHARQRAAGLRDDLGHDRELATRGHVEQAAGDRDRLDRGLIDLRAQDLGLAVAVGGVEHALAIGREPREPSNLGLVRHPLVRGPPLDHGRPSRGQPGRGGCARTPERERAEGGGDEQPAQGGPAPEPGAHVGLDRRSRCGRRGGRGPPRLCGLEIARRDPRDRIGRRVELVERERQIGGRLEPRLGPLLEAAQHHPRDRLGRARRAAPAWSGGSRRTPRSGSRPRTRGRR